MLIVGSMITPNKKKTNFASIKFMVLSRTNALPIIHIMRNRSKN